MPPSFSCENPLLSDSPRVWNDLLQSVGPASLLVAIEARLGPSLKRSVAAEDILQEALLHAWNSRASCEWRGLKAFRSWLLSIIDNRIHDAADHSGALKRGGGRPHASLQFGSTADHSGSMRIPAALMVSTTPSRLAIYREQAAVMNSALQSLPDELRDVVRMRLIEQRTLEHVATELKIGVAAARHRLRKGSEMYRLRVIAAMASQSHARSATTPQTMSPDSAPLLTEDSSDDQ
jgi:RNA polymerase sigma-70 factor (ECF subfamily)